MSPANPASATAASPFRALALAVAAAALLQIVRTGVAAFPGGGAPGGAAATAAGLPQGMVCTSCGPIATGEALAPLGALPRIGVADIGRPDPTRPDAERPPVRTPSIDQP